MEEDKRLKLPANWEAKKSRLEWELKVEEKKKVNKQIIWHVPLSQLENYISRFHSTKGPQLKKKKVPIVTTFSLGYIRNDIVITPLLENTGIQI